MKSKIFVLSIGLAFSSICTNAQIPTDSCRIEIKINKSPLVRKAGRYLVSVDSKPYCVVSKNVCSFNIAAGLHSIETESKFPLAIFRKKHKRMIEAVGGKTYHLVGKEELSFSPPRVILRLYNDDI